ncbi:unnamed protein product [Cyclocybe aegerita]|uniref:G-alpha-domain-containing protein n=1 Tax=Cyclocybe aegerita TaxID=1973307 RepID=A0A8S0WQW1_CYCAE|nr:unnamed protein product [Cyclocybe aegerita]
MGATEPDPFAIFHAPPPDETPGERAEREAKEVEAKRVSDVIDDRLRAEKLALKKDKYVVRVLLLGQAESGKSTTLKNFRMCYARAAWDAERGSWRSVIQLNILRSITTIVEVLQAEMDDEPIEPDTPTMPFSPLTPNTPFFEPPRPEPPALGTKTHPISKQPLSSLLTDKHQLLKHRLGPLRRVETDLKRRLGEGAVEEVDGAATNLGALGFRLDPDSGSLVRKQKGEWGVRRLQDALEKGSTARVGSLRGHESNDGGGEGGEDATDIIAGCREDMKALWSDEVVRVVLKKRKLRLEDSAGFFLDDLDRIAQRNYEPSDDDVVRARLRTLGVQEYRISFEPQNTGIFAERIPILEAGGIGGDAGKEWLLYDVGGSRTVRHAWLPYFDNVQAIIFLARASPHSPFIVVFPHNSTPTAVSCFDERLAEDSKINRLEDSFLLWRSVCGSKLLAKASMILFLNKCDLLKKKLKSGVQVKTHLPSYGERPNDVNAVLKYLKGKFRDILRQQSPELRQSYFYATTVIDTKATAATIKAVKDSILRDYLKSADLF